VNAAQPVRNDPAAITARRRDALTILDDDAPLVSFSTNAFRVSETNGEALISVKLSAASGRAVSINYSAAGGTATEGDDFKSVSGLLVFNPGETNKTFSVPIYDDSINEPGETVLLALSNPTNGVAGAPARLTIVDDDPPLASFSTNSYTVNEDGGSVSISVRLSSPFDQPIYVDFTTSDDTAHAGSDYIANSGTLVFAPGQTNKTFFITVLNDALAEGNEAISLSLDNLVNATEGAFTKAVLTIVDDDYARLSIQPVAANLVLSWTNTATGFVLQSTRNLSPGTSWSNVSAAVLTTNGQNRVSVSASPPGQYYRLKKP
jgi:hypothetical protein